MTVTAIQIGLEPDVIDYSSSDFAQFKGLSKEKLRAANDENVAALRAADYHVDNCLIDFGDVGADKARQWLEAKRYDAVLIGAGVRLVAAHTLLFEAIVNAAHVSQPIAASSSTAQPSPPPTTFVVGTRTRRRWRDDRS
jgi:hypothetical protein